MANKTPAEIATTLTVTAMKTGAIEKTPEAVSEYFKAVLASISPVVSVPQEVMFKWENSKSESEE